MQTIIRIDDKELAEAPKRFSEEVLRGVLSMLGGIIVIGLLVLIITLSG